MIFLKNYLNRRPTYSQIKLPSLHLNRPEEHFRLIRVIFVHFRNRVGQAGIEKIFVYSVKMHGEEVPLKSEFVYPILYRTGEQYDFSNRCYHREKREENHYGNKSFYG